MTSTIDGDWVEISVEPVEKVSFLGKKKYAFRSQTAAPV